jgi:hypothetical protein
MKMDKDGNVQAPHPHPATTGDGQFTPVVVASGVLTAGYANTTHPSIGWHSVVMVTPLSGTKTQGITYTIDVANQTIHFSGEDNADTRRFSYVLYNPGLGTPKLS